MIKKSIRLLLVGVLLTVFAAGGALASAKFNDVGDYWATEAIKWAAEKGVVEGYPDGTFRPTNHVTEAEFAAILARYVVNTDKDFISQRQPGKHWAQSIYDELRRWELPLNGYTNDIIKDTVITRGDVARVIAAKNGFNLDERQAVYYMYENDLSNGMIPNRMTFDSYGADQPLQRDQITQFMKLLNSKGYTTFLGEPSPKGNAGPADIIGNDNLIAINNALMVDLTGQICSEAIGHSQYSSTGGQLDFVRGARMSKGGKAFICLPSTHMANGVKKSNIMLNLTPGTAVTVPRADAQYIVTEYGIADVANKTISERAKEIIKIAHPDFRDELTKQAMEARLIV